MAADSRDPKREVDLDNEEFVGLSRNSSNNEQLLRELTDDYAKYLQVNVGKETKTLEDSVEEMLVRLDEFVTLIDMVRSDNSQCLSRTLPVIYNKCESFDEIRKKVDKLEAFVKIVRQNVDLMEEKVNLAEQELRQKTSFEKVLKPLFKKNVGNNSENKPTYQAPDIFRTSDYFADQELNKETTEDEVQFLN